MTPLRCWISTPVAAVEREIRLDRSVAPVAGAEAPAAMTSTPPPEVPPAAPPIGTVEGADGGAERIPSVPGRPGKTGTGAAPAPGVGAGGGGGWKGGGWTGG